MKNYDDIKEIENYSADYLNDLVKYLNDSIDFSLSDVSKVLTQYNLNEVKMRAKTFFDTYYNLHGVLTFPDIPKIAFIDNYLRNKVILRNNLISPFDVKFKINNRNSWCVLTLNQKYQNKNYSMVKYIGGPAVDDISTVVPSLVHEITHTQHPTKGFGLYTNINDELLSIFNETLASMEYDYKTIYIRLRNLLKSINYANSSMAFESLGFKKDVIKYIESNLRAYMLYFIYISSSNSSYRAGIIDNIQAVFDNNKTIEELLEFYDINESCYSSLGFIKEFKRAVLK